MPRNSVAITTSDNETLHASMRPWRNAKEFDIWQIIR